MAEEGPCCAGLTLVLWRDFSILICKSLGLIGPLGFLSSTLNKSLEDQNPSRQLLPSRMLARRPLTATNVAVNRIETRLPGTLDIAKRAGQLYSSYLRKRGEGCQKDTARFLDRLLCRSLRIPACNLESGGFQELSLDRGPDPWRGYQRE